MKRNIFTFLAIVMSIACLCMLTGCPSPESPAQPVPEDDGIDPALASRQTLADAGETGKIGLYGKPYWVGDIVFEDGSATPVCLINARKNVDSQTHTKITAAEKNAARAYIFYVGTELNNPDATGADDTTTERTLGVGLESVPITSGWACNVPGSTPVGATIELTVLLCPHTGSKENYTFSGVKNGEDSAQKLLSFTRAWDMQTKEMTEEEYQQVLADCEQAAIDVEEAWNAYVNDEISIEAYSAIQEHFMTLQDSIEELSDYPCFQKMTVYGNNYLYNTHYDSGWYMPSIAELYKLWLKKRDMYAAFALLGKNLDIRIASSSQSEDNVSCFDLMNFTSGTIETVNKLDNSNTFCTVAIREFPAE